MRQCRCYTFPVSYVTLLLRCSQRKCVFAQGRRYDTLLYLAAFSLLRFQDGVDLRLLENRSNKCEKSSAVSLKKKPNSTFSGFFFSIIFLLHNLPFWLLNSVIGNNGIWEINDSGVKHCEGSDHSPNMKTFHLV